VRADIVGSLNMDNPALLVGSFHRPNLIYHVQQRLPGLNQICSVMERFRGQAGIVYAITRDRVEKISSLLNQLGFRTRSYHAGMTDTDRERQVELLDTTGPEGRPSASRRSDSPADGACNLARNSFLRSQDLAA